jgi:hypothetical protein
MTKFIIRGTPYYIHTDLVSHHSRPLDRTINGQMAEAQQGFAVLEDVDEGTFRRFLEWAYKGYYKAADIELDATIPISPVPSDQKECETTGWTEGHPSDDIPAEELNHPTLSTEPPEDLDWEIPKQRKKARNPKTSRALKESFLRREYTIRREVISIPQTRANRGAHEDYTEVFLSHAQLYVFAETYDIQPLKTLALEELHRTLAVYNLHRRRTGDIIALLRYVYANTIVSARGGEDLRTLLKDYVGYEMSTLVKDEEFSELMLEDGGALLRDFMKVMAKRLT